MLSTEPEGNKRFEPDDGGWGFLNDPVNENDGRGVPQPGVGAEVVGERREGMGMTSRAWTRTAIELPPSGVEVEVMNGQYEQTLIFEKGLWWLPDRSMYVYFTPTLWRLPNRPGAS